MKTDKLKEENTMSMRILFISVISLLFFGCSNSNEKNESDYEPYQLQENQWTHDDYINTDFGIEGVFEGIVFGDSMYNKYITFSDSVNYPIFSEEFTDGFHHTPYFFINLEEPKEIFGMPYDEILVSGIHHNIYSTFIKFKDSDSTKYGSITEGLTKEFGSPDSIHAEAGYYFREWNNDVAKVEFRNIENWGTSLIYHNRIGMDLRKAYVGSLEQAYQQTEYLKPHSGKVNFFTTSKEFFEINKGELAPFYSNSIFEYYDMDYARTMYNLLGNKVTSKDEMASFKASFDTSIDSLYEFRVEIYNGDEEDSIIRGIIGERYKNPDLSIVQRRITSGIHTKLDFYYYKNLLLIISENNGFNKELIIILNPSLSINVFDELGTVSF